MIRNTRFHFVFFLALLWLFLSFSIGQSLFAQEATPTPSLVTIEGPIQSIGGNAITISGINIQINQNDPTWATLQVGDVVRVQANTIQQNNTVILVAVVIIIVVDVDTVTPTPEVTPEATPELTPEATPGVDDDDQPPVIIVIEGPVQAINVNIITIYNINIQLASNDPLLTVIQIGDIVHVQGNVVNQGSTIVIIAVTIIIVNVDVVVVDGNIWRDHGDCSNPPPPWAPAHGWHRRCDIIVVPAPNNGGGKGMGMGGS